MDLSLKNRTALVCGASQGIGETTAIELAALGANVIVAARSKDKLLNLIERLPNEGNQHHEIMLLDFENRSALSEKLNKRISQGPIEILVHKTGGPKAGLVEQATEAQFEQAFANHLLTARLMTEKLLPGMKAQGFGRIINITSTSVKIPIPNLGVSNTVRWAVTAWAKTLSQEIAKDGITVNIVLPGFTQTPRLEGLISGQVNTTGKAESEITQKLVESVPAKRFGLPSEVANAIAFLASPAAAYINGITLAVDGGRTGCI